MPTLPSELFSENQVKPFGLTGSSGARSFQTSLEILKNDTTGSSIQFLAILGGRVVTFDTHTVVATRADESYYLTGSAGFFIEAINVENFWSKLAENNPNYPIQHSLPHRIVYEGVTLNPELLGDVVDSWTTLDEFLFDSSELPVGHESILDDIAIRMTADSKLNLHLIGHTDSKGQENYNINLGASRANKVKEYLSEHPIYQVDSNRISTDSQGESEPVDVNAPDPVNRRVHIQIKTSEDGTVVTSGQNLGASTNGLKISVFDSNGYVMDPLDLALRWDTELADHPLAQFRDPLSPVVASNHVHCVSNYTADKKVEGDQSVFNFYENIPDAIHAASENDIVWVSSSDTIYSINLEIDKSLSLIGKSIGDDGIILKPTLNQDLPTSSILKVKTPFIKKLDGIRIFGFRFQNARSLTDGAAINCSGTSLKARVFDIKILNIHISQCIFANNKTQENSGKLAHRGGAIFLEHATNILLESCEFVDNHAKYGGALAATSCYNLVIGGLENQKHGDALTYSGELTEIDVPVVTQPSIPSDVPEALLGVGYSSVFNGNRSAFASPNVWIKNSNFRIHNTFFANGLQGISTDIIENNTKLERFREATYGGAIGVQAERLTVSPNPHQAKSVILNCTAVNNEVEFGGAFCVVGSGDNATDLVGNESTWLGAGNVVFENNLVFRNKATRIGGAVHVTGGATTNFKNNRISQNTAKRSGGGISLIAVKSSQLNNNTIDGNKVTIKDPERSPGGGAGIYVTLSPSVSDVDSLPDIFEPGELAESRVTLEHNLITKNVSTEDGGGIRATCGVSLILGTGNRIRENKAYRWGGGVSIRNARLEIKENNEFVSNSCTVGPPGYHSGGSGGAISLAADVASMDPSFLGSDVNVFSGAWKFQLCVKEGARLRANGTANHPIKFQGNTASHQGGALHVFQRVLGFPDNQIGKLLELVISHAEFSDNSSEAAPNNDTTGSTIQLIGVNSSIKHPPSDDFRIQDTTIQTSSGIGLYMVNSNLMDRNTTASYTVLEE